MVGSLMLACSQWLELRAASDLPAELDRYNVVWTSPSANASGSMPIGNGDIGANVWAEENGDLMLYLGKTDAWDEQSRLLKLGRLRVHFANNPFATGMPFRQELVLRDGVIRIEAGRGTNAVRIRLWVDAHNPVVHVEAEADQPFEQSVRLEPLRTERRQLTGWEKHAVDGLSVTEPPMQYPDVVVDTAKQLGLTQHLVWYHRNEVSVHSATLNLQELDPARCAPDPLLGRTFGCAVAGGEFVTVNPCLLETAAPVGRTHILISPLTLQTPTVEAWLKALGGQATRSRTLDLATAHTAHQRWWAEFWQRAWVRVSGGDARETGDITLGWHLNRYLTACTARGLSPVKFNGAMFNVDGIDADGNPAPGNSVDARAWGGCFWFQNQRHIYWPMLQAGDYEQMLPFFKMYYDALPLAVERTKIYYRHEGAVFPETMYFWGAYANSGGMGYGWDRRGKEPGLTDNGYIRRYWQGGLELTAMMLEYYRHTQDSRFASNTLLPLAEPIITFYDQHYQRDAQGKIRIEPAQVLETVWDAVNPTPEIAGLTCGLNGLLALPEALVPVTQRAQWRRLLDELSPLPTSEVQGVRVLDSALIKRGEHHNIENGNLYALWPYANHCVGAGNLKLAQDSYRHRWKKGGPYQCWMNDNLFAAYAGLASEATDHLAFRFVRSDALRFRAFYTHGDWVPDLDNGGVCQNTIQSMLMQTCGKKIVLLPAWPKEWDADFKLHAPYQTTVEGSVRSGKLIQFKCSPESRRRDIEILPAQ